MAVEALSPFCPRCGAVLAVWPAHLAGDGAVECDWRPDAELLESLRGEPHVLDLLLPVGGSPAFVPAQGRLPSLLAVGVGGAEDAEGGIVVVDPVTWAELWRVPVGAGVIGLLALGRRIVFGDARGYVHALDLDSKILRSTVAALGGPISAAPTAFDPNIVIVATGTGVVARIDLRAMEPCGVYELLGAGGGALRLDGGVTVVGQDLFVGTHEDFGLHGRLLQVDPSRRSFRSVASFPAGVYGSPLSPNGSGAIVVLSSTADQSAALVSVELRHGRELGRFTSQGRIRAMPTLDSEGTVYVGSQDHRLHALDAQSLQPRWPAPFTWRHGITSPTLVLPSLLLFGDNRGMVVAVDRAQPGDQPVWQQAAPPLPPQLPERRPPMVLGAPTAVGGYVVYGDRSGQLQIVPQLGGNLAWGRQRAEQSGDLIAAATFVLLQGGRRPVKAAADLFAHGGMSAEAARCYAASDNWTEAAGAYEQAGHWRQAADCCERLQQGARVSELLEQAARDEGLPFLHVQPEQCTPLKVGEWSRLSLSVENLFPTKARQIRLLVKPVLEGAPPELELPAALSELAKGSLPWKPEIRIRPNAAGELTLGLRLDCRDDALGRSQTQHFTIKSMAVAAADQPAVHVNIERCFGENSTSITGDLGYLSSASGSVDVGGSVGAMTRDRRYGRRTPVED